MDQPRTVNPDLVTQILTNPDSDLYPAAISVYCDRCGATATNQFLVRDQDSSAERFEIARDHLRGLGWSCTEAGDFCCNCLAIEQGAAEPPSARAVLLAELLDGEIPDAPEYPASRARLERLLDDHAIEAVVYAFAGAADHLDGLADQVEARVAEHYGRASGVGPGSADMVREAAKTVRELAARTTQES